MPTAPVREHVTGLVLAGGQGRRMGGVDKAQLHHQGQPLLAHVLSRLTPQVARVLVSTARGVALPGFGHLDVAWLADPLPSHQGPLAGLLAGLRACPTEWLVSVPCDAPQLPLDLVERLARALAEAGAAAHGAVLACTRHEGQLRTEPVFTLLHRQWAADLEAALERGERAPHRWLASVGAVPALFDDSAAFFNANTPEDLMP